MTVWSGSTSGLTDTNVRPEATNDWLVLVEPGGEHEFVSAGAVGEITLEDDREVSAGFQCDGVGGVSANDLSHIVNRKEAAEGVVGR